MELVAEYCCVHCNQPIDTGIGGTPDHCTGCQQAYPAVDGIPVLVRNAEAFLAEAVLIYNSHLAARTKKAEEIKKNAAHKILRRNALENLAYSVEQNLVWTRNIIDCLKSHVSTDHILDAVQNFQYRPAFAHYLNDFLYLKKDWCWLPEGESSTDLVVGTVRRIIEDHLYDQESCLVVGAGLGRYAVELSDTFQTVYATDKSFSMAYFFNRLLQQDIYFYEINEKNLSFGSHMYRRLKASLVPPYNTDPDHSFKEKARQVNYFVSDIMELPLTAKSISVFLSIYFTDVLALKLYMPEVKRLIRDNGLFIHYGPLDYPFENIGEKLSPDDIKTVFIQNGFEIVVDTFVSNEYIVPDGALQSRVFNNWVFAAKKLPAAERGRFLTKSSVLSFNGSLPFAHKGHLSDDGVEQMTVLTLPDGEFLEYADGLFDILNLVNGKRTVEDILDLISKEYELNEETEKQVIEQLEGFIRQNILTMT